jgi:hypothetical protein
VGKWSWNANTARRVNGFGNPVDRAPAVRDNDGRLVPEWRRRAILPPDLRVGADDPEDPRLHPENFPPARMWAHYFEGARDPRRCANLDRAIADGLCVALGAVAGVYTPAQILDQVYGRRPR